MRIVLASAAALIVSLTAGAAFAQAQSQELSQPTMTPVALDGTGPGNEVICRAFYHNGSLIHTSTCHTRAQWQALRYVTEREIEDTQIRSFHSLVH